VSETVQPPRRARRHFVGRPMTSGQLEDELLPVPLALPIFAADAISSVAYATEAAMVVLLGAGLVELHVALPISIAVAVLMGIVIASYRQTVRAYETSGGAYIVARENLGTLPSLVAAAALLVDYVLTVAVSVSSGVLAITSAVTSLDHYNTELSLGAVLLITFVNLRGVRESGFTFALPTYLFIIAMFAAVGTGLFKCATSTCPQAVAPHPLAAGTGALGIFLVLKAFASGASALTGVEAIANGVNAFKHPQAKNAARTLGALAIRVPRSRSFRRSRVQSSRWGAPRRGCSGSSRSSRSPCSSSRRTRRSRASRGSLRCSRTTASSPASSRTSATGSCSRTASSFSLEPLRS
jgi:amino acid transporter